MIPRLAERRAATQRARDARTEPERRAGWYRRQAERHVYAKDEPPLTSGVLWQ